MADVYRDPETRRRTVVVGKAEKADREGRRAKRERELDGHRNVLNVDDLRRTRTEYYSRPVAERERERERYAPLDQELDFSKDGRTRRRGNTKVKEVKRRNTEKERDGDEVPRRHHSRRKPRVVEEDYVYRDARDPPPRRAKSARSTRSAKDPDADEDRRDYYRQEKPRTRVIHVEDDRTETPAEKVYARYAPAQAQSSPEKSSKLSRSSTKIGSGSHRTRSSTVRSRSRSRSRRAGSIKGGRTVKIRSREARPPMPSLPEDGLPSASPTKERRRGSFFNGLFAGKAKTESPRIVECLTCASEVPAPKTAVLGCGHVMCHRCLKHIFTMSVTDPQHMPPRCCTSKHIPLKFVDKLFDDRFKVRWNKKFQEYTTKNRLYCPARGCGTWIPPQELRPSRIDPKRSIGTCHRCSTRVCAKCGRKWHTNEDCDRLDRDEGAREFVKMAAESGWQRCYNCTATVERKEGCNHMTCRCGAEFCILCGEKWKGCDCPWFNATQLMDEDRLEMPNDIGARQDHDDAPRARQRAGWAEEQARRREQERRDEEVARRMQGIEIEEWDNEVEHDRGNGHGRDQRSGARTPAMERNWGGNDTYGFGNMAGHFLNDNFVQRATRILTGTFNEQNRDAANRLVHEIRSDRAPPLPRTAVVDPVREQHRAPPSRDTRSRGGERERPVSRRMQAGDILDGAGIPRHGSTRRRPQVERSPARGGDGPRDRERDDVEGKRRSVLAGLATAPGESRIDQWRNNVQEGEPDFGPA